MKAKQFLLTIVTLMFSFVLLGGSVFAQSELPQEPPKEEALEAVVEKVLEEKQIKPMGSEDLQLYQKLELLVTKGSLKDKKITVENGDVAVANNLKYKVNDKAMVVFGKNFEGDDTFYITDYIRRDSLLWLFIIFVVVAIVIAKWRGILSLVGMGI